MRGTRKINGKQYTAYRSGREKAMHQLKKKLRKDNPQMKLAVRKSWRRTEPGKYILYTRDDGKR